MSDFSAAAILRLVPLGLKRQGIDMAVQAAPRQARLAVGDKRQLLDSIAKAHGEHALVRLGEGVFDAADEPILTAMAMARAPGDLVARWQRLERYLHSKHRVRIERTEVNGMMLRHLSLRDAPPPLRHEDLLILGLLIGLLEWIGTQGLKLRLYGETDWRYQRHEWRTKDWPTHLAHWEISWTGTRTHARASHAVGSRQPPNAAEELVNNARAHLSLDPSRPWTVAALAQEMNMAARSLQRLLTNRQSSFSTLLAQVRTTSAAHALTTTRQSFAQIGYACGYADQAHFGREFKRQTALTPLQYRTEFTA